MYQMSLFETDEKIGQENENDLGQQDQSKFSEAVMWATDWTTETLITQLKKGNIELSPSFQRRDAWGGSRKSSFIESIILGLPIPQIILAERKEKKGSYLVIDGKQRLLSIRQFCSTEIEDSFEPLKLNGLKILKDINGKNYFELITNDIYSDYVNAFDNCPIRTVVIKNWPDQNFLYTVFLRLNTGSLPLSPQELRQALNPGPFTDYLDEYSENSDALKRALNLNKPDYRMRDVEISLRYFGYKNFMTDYTGNLKSFLDKTCEALNKQWNEDNSQILKQAENLDRAIECTFQIFGENAFNKFSDKGYTRIFNRPVFDIMTYYYSEKGIRDKALLKSGEIKVVFESLCTKDIDFLRSLETSTKNVDAVSKRFYQWGEELKKILGIEIRIPQRGDIGMTIK